MALNNIVQFTDAIETAAPAEFAGAIGGNASTSAAGSIYAQAQAAGAEMYVNEYGAANAFRVVEGGAGAAGTGTATEILQFEPIVDGTTGEVTGANIVKMPAQGNVKAGALSGQVPIGTVAAGVAIGAGIGLKEAATHRQFWEDLVSIGDGINSPEQTIQVIWRMMQDGSIQSYCDKRSVDRLIDKMYELNCIVGEGTVTPDVEPGTQVITLGEINEAIGGIAAQGGGYPYASRALTAAWQALPQYTGPYNGVWVIVMPTMVTILTFNIGDTPRPVYIQTDVSGNYLACDIFDGEAVGGVNVGYVIDTGEIRYIEPSPTRPRNVRITPGPAFSGYGTTNIGCDVEIPERNPNVIVNPDALKAPENRDDFWSTFSTWLNNSLQQPGYNPLNNAIVPTTWIPFTFPNINWQLDPAIGTQTDVWPGTFQFPDPFTDPQGAPAPDADPWIWRGIGDYIVPHIDIPYPDPTPWDDTPHVDPVKPNNPSGNTPAILPPSSGLSNALFTVYNPTQAQVNALGAYLWTQNIIELIAQFFQNPLDAIISLHMVYCTPTTGSPKNIKLGYLDSGVAADVVTSQYVDIACGDIQIPEMYRNALDYNGVDIQIFLPFIGFRALNTKEVMGATLRVIYKVDVYTGICLASIYVIRPGASQLLYTFEGNCSIDIPLTSADRSRLVSGLITAGVSAVTGNPAGVVGGLASVHASIERSGSFSGNAGAMGVKKPYVIIKRAISAQATNYAKQYGYPLNKSAKLGSFTGYTRVESVHVDIPGATDTEKRMIESMLKNGIII